MAADPHPATIPADALLADCDVQRTRRSGPGGQHRNKVSSAIVLAHRPTGVTVTASERRSQRENLGVALFRLRVALAVRVRRAAAAGPPSDLWRSRCGGGRIAVNPNHPDFPAVLAEALDRLAGAGWEPRPAANALACSSSQLIKLLKDAPGALAHVNARRAELGLHPLK